MSSLKDMRKLKGDEMDLEGLVDHVGSCGKFQVLLVCATFGTLLHIAGGMMFMVFGSYNPGWDCLGEDNTSLSWPTALPTGHPTGQPTGQTTDLPLANTSSQPANWELSSETSLTANASVTESASGAGNGSCDIISRCSAVAFVEGSSTVVTEWGLICDKAWVPSVIISVQMVGVFVGSVLSGAVGDRLGRKVSLYGHISLHTLVHLVIIFSTSWEMYAALNFFIGVAVGGMISTAYVYPVEFVSQWWRGMLGTLPAWNVSSALFSAIVLWLRDWKLVHAVICGVSALTLLPVFWTPESMRWLTVSGSLVRAHAVAKKIAKCNGREVPSVEMMRSVSEQERKKNAHVDTYSYLDLFRGKTLCIFSIKMGIVWLCMSITYFTISFGIKSLSGDFYLNFLLFSLTELPGLLMVAPTTNKLGRRRAGAIHFLTSASACLIVVLMIFFAPNSSSTDLAINILALVAKMVITGAWMVATIFTMEIYPTVVRSLGVGYVNSASRIGAIISPYIVTDSPDLLWLPFLINVVVLVICTLLMLSMPETLGSPLPDTMVHTPVTKRQLLLVEPDTDKRVGAFS
ncbi:solute carrier family 22 member 5 [Aplysia californica]|uniref:Solute carrier family 22 member 5 n=1 Tax=Aplysia californica TaxID=6500 RepID=A0ABM0JD53_APLCA|nr:solute carrier family 22 member 5 [Aplysia californica]